jgi:hypothetical protein
LTEIKGEQMKSLVVVVVALVSVLGSSAAFADPVPRESCDSTAVRNAVAWLNMRYDVTARQLENDEKSKQDFASEEDRAKRIFITSNILLESGLVVGSAGAFLAGSGTAGAGLLISAFGDYGALQKGLKDVKGNEGIVYSPRTVTDQSCVEFSKVGMTFSQGITQDLQAFQQLREKLEEQAQDEQNHIKSHWYDLGWGDLKYIHSMRHEELREADIDQLENDYARRVLKIHAADCISEVN